MFDSEKLAALVNDYLSASATEKQAKAWKENTGKQIKAILGDTESAWSGDHRLDYKPVQAMQIDAEMLKTLFPAVYAQVARPTVKRPLYVR